MLKILIIGVSFTMFFYISPLKSEELKWKANTKGYGEPCLNDDECVDFRMICDKVHSTCQCDEIHDWRELNHNKSGCVLNMSSLKTYLIEKEEVQFERGEKLSAEAHSLFVYFGIWGIIIISIGVLLAMGCVAFVLL